MNMVKISREDGSRIPIESEPDEVARMAKHLGWPVPTVQDLLDDPGVVKGSFSILCNMDTIEGTRYVRLWSHDSRVTR